MAPEDILRGELAKQPYPLLFATITGAHLYGFPSPDSDYDVRGCHLLPVREVVGLGNGRETVERTYIQQGIEIDLVTHDLKKFMQLLLKKDGNALEQLYSPLVLQTTPAHEELKAIGRQCITRHHSHHYFGFAETQWKLFLKETPHRVKPLLYIYRVLLTGTYLMQTGEVQAHLLRLNDTFKLAYLPDLVARKLAGAEQGVLPEADLAFYQGEYERLRTDLEASYQATTLPEGPAPAAKDALNDLLVRLRLETQK
jgi:predicted nucleotidyltransferase